ncbi:Auxin-responsive protein IAA27 [Capsicum annuum]|uniref:Auxin-responsive protein n=1 Tax=Capsicum annuum TaxID=4072 RepID=A0A2G2Z3K0_CAPAN|nr:Auxin-responsive protein IAA27 [Capsicum annuum]
MLGFLFKYVNFMQCTAFNWIIFQLKFLNVHSGEQPPKKEAITQNAVQERPCAVNQSSSNRAGRSSPAPKAQVSMDGGPYSRKVDLRTHSAYQELSSALENMFSFTLGQYGSHGALGKKMLNESKLKVLLHGSDYVLSYEDKDGYWMLVGNVPWEMFTGTCMRL